MKAHECRTAVGGVEFAVPRRDGIERPQLEGFVVRPKRVLIGQAAEVLDCTRLSATVIDRSYQGAIIRYRMLLGGRRSWPKCPTGPIKSISPTRGRGRDRKDHGERRAIARLIRWPAFATGYHNQASSSIGV